MPPTDTYLRRPNELAPQGPQEAIVDPNDGIDSPLSLDAQLASISPLLASNYPVGLTFGQFYVDATIGSTGVRYHCTKCLHIGKGILSDLDHIPCYGCDPNSHPRYRRWVKDHSRSFGEVSPSLVAEHIDTFDPECDAGPECDCLDREGIIREALDLPMGVYSSDHLQIALARFPKLNIPAKLMSKMLAGVSPIEELNIVYCKLGNDEFWRQVGRL